MRYRGTSVAGLPEWDEAVRLLLLMLAPAAPHITEELWSRRLAAAGRAVGLDPHPALAGGRRDGGRRGDPRGPDPGQRQAPRPGHRAGRDQRDRARGRPSSPATRSARSLDGKEPLTVVHAGGGRLVNIVVRPTRSAPRRAARRPGLRARTTSRRCCSRTRRPSPTTARALRLRPRRGVPRRRRAGRLRATSCSRSASRWRCGTCCSRSSPTRPTSTSSSPTASICPIPTA